LAQQPNLKVITQFN